MSDQQLLYLWFDRDPTVFLPDQSLDDVPGTADIDLLTAAIVDGQLGEILPSRVYMSTHQKPDTSRSVRSIDIGKLLRDLGIEHRRCYQITIPE